MEYSFYGRGIKKGVKITAASVVDVTPTVLYMSGVPVARDMDGKVLSQLFIEPLAVDYIETYEKDSSGRSPEKYAFDKKMKEMLENLGYM